jgi:hypothetical protein
MVGAGRGGRPARPPARVPPDPLLLPLNNRTHYHLVIQATVDQLSTGMRQLNGIYAQHFNARYERRGHVFAERFSAWVLEDDDHFEATLAYVVGNPVRAGLCRSPEEWQWSGLGAPPPGTDPGLSLGSSEWRDASGKAA